MDHLREDIEKHLSSAALHGYNDAQQDNDGGGDVCRLEAQVNSDNTIRCIKAWALGMISDYQEPNPSDYYDKGIKYEEDKAVFMFIKELRQRIEESTK